MSFGGINIEELDAAVGISTAPEYDSSLSGASFVKRYLGENQTRCISCTA